MQQPSVNLTVRQGSQRGQRFSLDKDSIILGRVAGSDVVISDPEVSRRHASITWEGGQPIIRDLGSTNGTFVNGVRLTAPQALRDGDTIGLGKVQLGFQCPVVAGVSPEAARPAPPPTYAPPPSPLAEAGRGLGGFSWPALGLFGLAIVILLVAAAVGAYLYTQRGEKVAGMPTVIINSPPVGSQVQVGQEVTVQATATDPKGVTQVELLVNGVLYHSDVSPSRQGQSPFISRQSWRALAPGTYTLMVKAYNAAGGVTESAAIIINVTGAATPGPGQPTATPVVPTATPTATSTPAPATPTETWTPIIVVVTYTPTPTPTGCTLDATFLTDVTVPDGKVFPPGTTFNKIWRIRNSGSCPWQSGYTWVFVSGDQMGAPPSQPIPATAAGANVDIGVTMDAPSAAGTYTGYWRMQSPSGELFGQTCSVSIVVASPSTATPTATPTSSPSPGAEYSLVADKSTVNASIGECVTLTWHVKYVREAYLDGAPLVGENGTKTDCPCHNKDYTLHVVKTDGSTDDKKVSVTVTGSCGGGPSVLYDFIAQAPSAHWFNNVGEDLPWPGADNDNRGFALWRDNYALEDGSHPARVLETHPKWEDDGSINGDYTVNVTIKSGDMFKARIGFISGANAGDARWVLGYREGGTYHSLASETKAYDGNLKDFTVGLSSLDGKVVNFELRVWANGSAAQDWAIWQDARIERP